MKKIENYNIIPFNEYRYVTFPCDAFYVNTNFDDILVQIGKFYYQKPELSINQICTLIRDDINKTFRLNKLRKTIQLKKISTTQIKTIRRSFNKIKNRNECFIRIPFNAATIIFFIIHLFNSIDNENANTRQQMVLMNRMNIGEYIYNKQLTILNFRYKDKCDMLTDEKLKKRYKQMKAQLTSEKSYLNNHYCNVNWNDISAFKKAYEII